MTNAPRNAPRSPSVAVRIQIEVMLVQMASPSETPKINESRGDVKYMMHRADPSTYSVAPMGSQFIMSVEAAEEDWLNSNMRLNMMERKTVNDGIKIRSCVHVRRMRASFLIILAMNR